MSDMNKINKIITLEDGWDNQIKINYIDVIEGMLDRKCEIKKVRNKFISNKDYIAIYTTVHGMCTQEAPHNYSKELYERHGNTIRDYLTRKVLPAIQNKGSLGSVPLLQELNLRWENHILMNKLYSKVFGYLDRFYVKFYSLLTLSQVGLTAFKDHIYEHVKDGAKDAIIELINKERDGEIIEKDLIKNTVKLYEAMGMGSLDTYNSDLEAQILESTQEYYAKKREDWIDTDSTPEYLKKVENILNDESNRVREYLNLGTESKLRKVVEEILDEGPKGQKNKVNEM